MPANLPPQYFEVEKKLKAAKSSDEKIAIMEELLSIIPKHKGTEKLQALYKTKIAKLKTQSQKKAGASRRGDLYHIEKAEAGQVVLIGPPNSGKSSLVKALTNADPEVADYPFTTHSPAPAMMKYENIQIQLIDTPPITQDYFEYWQAEMIKNADLVLVVIDLAGSDPALDYLALKEKLLERKIVLNPSGQAPPQAEFGFYKKTLILGNKTDLTPSQTTLSEFYEFLEGGEELIPVSSTQAESLGALKDLIFNRLEILRVYSKTPGKKPSLDEPFIFRRGSTLMDMAKSVHRDFAKNLKFARIWGGQKYQGQKVNRDYVLQDEDIIELHI
jgi:ribosome-interacting GTPase 1